MAEFHGNDRTAPAGFNEAGPQGTGKCRNAAATRRTTASFNEAGPQGTAKCLTHDPPVMPHPASMRPARKGPENGRRRRHGAGEADASMRPARKGPENVGGRAKLHHRVGVLQ